MTRGIAATWIPTIAVREMARHLHYLPTSRLPGR